MFSQAVLVTLCMLKFENHEDWSLTSEHEEIHSALNLWFFKIFIHFWMQENYSLCTSWVKERKLSIWVKRKPSNLELDHLCLLRPPQTGSEQSVNDSSVTLITTNYCWILCPLMSLPDLFLERPRVCLRCAENKSLKFSQPLSDNKVSSHCESPGWGHSCLCCWHSHHLSWNCSWC